MEAPGDEPGAFYWPNGFPLRAPHRPVICSRRSGYRAPSTRMSEEARSISSRSSSVSSMASAPMFSSRRFSFVVPGMGTIQGFSGEQPRKCYLSRRRVLPMSDFGEQVYHGLVRLPRLWRKARKAISEIGTVERGALIDLAGKESPAQRAIGHEADTEVFERREDLGLRMSPPDRVFTLDRSDWLDSVCAADRLCPWFRKAEVLHLALLD